ncbi:MAG: hypothetical protein M1325_04340, partial [Actinobacteria bacterium]|nr:hypothetical protein [Actinomycetota bacterium]
KVLAGLQELHLLNTLTTAASLLSLAAVVMAIELHASLPLLALSLQGPVVLVLGIGTVVLFGWHRPDLRPSLQGVSARTGLDMLRQGSGFFAIQVAGVVIFQVQAFIISARLSVAEVTPYAVAARLFMTLPPLVAVAFGAIWPAYADAKARGELEWVARVFAGATRRGLLAGGLLIAFLVIWSEPLIRLWAGPAAYGGAALIVVIALLAVLEVWVSSTAVCLNGLGRTRGQVLSATLRAGVGFGLAWYAAPAFGVLGVVVASLVATILLAPTILGYDLVTSTGGRVRLRGTVSWITPVTFVVAAVTAFTTDFGGPFAAHATTWRTLAAGVVAAVAVWSRRAFLARSWGAFQRRRAAGFRL